MMAWLKKMLVGGKSPKTGEKLLLKSIYNATQDKRK